VLGVTSLTSQQTVSDKPDITLSIVSWNTRELLRECLASIEGGARAHAVEVHVIDNASSDESARMVKDEFPNVTVIANQTNVGFARANDQSWSQAAGRYWMLLNSDTEVAPGSLDALIEFMDHHPQCGLATARLVNPDGTPQNCAQPVPCVWLTLLEGLRLHKVLSVSRRGRLLLGSYWSYDRSIKVGWTWGTALIARREAVDEVGPLSEDFFMYGEDLEWCLRMRRRSWEIWYCAEAEVLHHGGQSSAQRWDDKGRLYKILDGVYQALGKHRGRAYVWLLQATTLFVLVLEWLASSVRGHRSMKLPFSLAYHFRAVKGAH
jgi:GT2 family glycosyltransferase